MQIELISQEQFDIISNIQKEHNVLTFQNIGYESIKEKLNETEEEAKMKVSKILGNHIKGYSSFQNFRFSKKENKLEIRFQYNYNYNPNSGLPFIGVGYILLEELLNGFKDN